MANADQPHNLLLDETQASAHFGSAMPYLVVGTLGLATAILLARFGGSLTVTSEGVTMTVGPPLLPPN